MMKQLKKKRKGGFTLIELIVVIAILGILAGIAVPRLINATDGADAAARDANVRTLNGSVAIYLAQKDNNLTTLLVGTSAGNTTANATAVYGILVAADVIQANLALGDITFDTADNSFK